MNYQELIITASGEKTAITTASGALSIGLDVGAGAMAKPDDATGHAAHFGGYLSGRRREKQRDENKEQRGNTEKYTEKISKKRKKYGKIEKT